jgi:EpsI family protein
MRNLNIAVPIFVAAQALLVHWAAGGERPPKSPDLAQFPAAFGEWRTLREDPIEEDVRQQLHADRLLSRTYIQDQTNYAASLFVAWFQSQRAGVSQPHSPQVCLPGSGWVPQVKDDAILETAAGSIAVNRYVVVNRGQRAVVLYWYQTPRRVIEGEWAAKFWTISDALRDRRTDTALVRIVTWAAGGRDDTATATAVKFGQDLYPGLRQILPR